MPLLQCESIVIVTNCKLHAYSDATLEGTAEPNPDDIGDVVHSAFGLKASMKLVSPEQMLTKENEHLPVSLVHAPQQSVQQNAGDRSKPELKLTHSLLEQCSLPLSRPTLLTRAACWRKVQSVANTQGLSSSVGLVGLSLEVQAAAELCSLDS